MGSIPFTPWLQIFLLARSLSLSLSLSFLSHSPPCYTRNFLFTEKFSPRNFSLIPPLTHFLRPFPIDFHSAFNLSITFECAFVRTLILINFFARFSTTKLFYRQIISLVLGNEHWLVFPFHLVYVLPRQEEKSLPKKKERILRHWLMGMRKNFIRALSYKSLCNAFAQCDCKSQADVLKSKWEMLRPVIHQSWRELSLVFLCGWNSSFFARERKEPFLTSERDARERKRMNDEKFTKK